MSPIKDFRISFEPLNNQGTVSDGDTIVGAVTFTLTKETKVKRLKLKAKGGARVHWSEGSGDRRRSHTAVRTYFKVKLDLIPENSDSTVLTEGTHCFKYALQIPTGNMPPPFKSYYGNIYYVLEAKISRSWHLPSIVQMDLNFVPRSSPYFGQIKCPQVGSVGKEVGVFSKGQVHIEATVNKNICYPGETLSVVAKIRNSSSKEMVSKFSLQKRIVYRAGGSHKYSHENLGKLVGNTITPNSEQTVSCPITVPANAGYSLFNCDIITVEYHLKVYVDISFAFDPEVVFPLIIVPPSLAASLFNEAGGPYPAGAAMGPSYSDFPAPTPAFPGSSPIPAGPGAYGYPAPIPNQHAGVTSGFNNQMPQQPTQYGFPAAPFPFYSGQPQTPNAPPQFSQGEDPPSYTALYPPITTPASGTGYDQKS
ncbi:arrestin domain-containing protein 3-like [Sphaeramia orbicularis]|uniref:arrestin domain-containing protein 3-like n=1 Tax=Sphaeramia orbicularis TaxID=375764 RepID=UPI00117C6B04|nr:arrestin domain-containing protein 3-like [Sphaeramia orbicularis]